MRLTPAIALLSGLTAIVVAVRIVPVAAATHTNLPTYTAEGNLIPPANYREWVFLSSGYDMAYTERAPAVPGQAVPAHSVFDNVFVNPEAYAAFQKTGTWPDQTVMVLENRAAHANTEPLLKNGLVQGDITGIEIHVKDATHFKESGPGGQWAFFSVKDGQSKLFPRTATCYTCHAEHAAVDTTFVQFYPTLLPIAESKSTLSEPYRKDHTSPPQSK